MDEEIMMDERREKLVRAGPVSLTLSPSSPSRYPTHSYFWLWVKAWRRERSSMKG